MTVPTRPRRRRRVLVVAPLVVALALHHHATFSMLPPSREDEVVSASRGGEVSSSASAATVVAGVVVAAATPSEKNDHHGTKRGGRHGGRGSSRRGPLRARASSPLVPSRSEEDERRRRLHQHEHESDEHESDNDDDLTPNDGLVGRRRRRRRLRFESGTTDSATTAAGRAGGRGRGQGQGRGRRRIIATTTATCQWYPKPSPGMGCTNDPDGLQYEWIDNPIALHPTAEACCDTFFGGMGATCELSPDARCEEGGGTGDGNGNGNGNGNGGGGPGDGSGSGSGGMPSPSSCEWYPDPATRDGCANDPGGAPPEWRGDALMMHPTSGGCCEAWFRGQECRLYPYDGSCDADDEGSTPTSTSCISLGWHADTLTQGGCTDDDNYPEQWLEGTMRMTMFHPTPERCCSLHFPGGECEVVHSGCLPEEASGDGDGDGDGDGEDCVSAGWHSESTFRDGCSNGNSYPDEWVEDPLLSGQMFFQSSQECCDRFFRGQECKLYDEGCTIEDGNMGDGDVKAESQPSDLLLCDYAKWHISLGASSGLACSNSLEYPIVWDDPAMSDKFLFDSHFDCCAHYAPNNPDECGEHHDCEEAASTTSSVGAALKDSGTSCGTARWHMTQDFTRCSNNFEYPLSWLDEEAFYFFDDPIECCVSVFNYADCPIEDICEDYVAPNAMSKSPTPEPTLVEYTGTPTGTPSTGDPTLAPFAEAKIPTGAPLEELNGPNENPNRCSGKNGRQCSKDPVCQYDKSAHICAKIEPNSQPPDVISAHNPTRSPVFQVPSRCSGKAKRLCLKDLECQYDRAERNCVDIKLDYQPRRSPLPNEQTARDTPPDIRCAGSSKKKCVKTHQCFWNNSSHSCVPRGTIAGEIEEKRYDVSPTTSPVTNAPMTSPMTEALTMSTATDAPSKSPVTEAPTTSPVTNAPTSSPTTKALMQMTTSASLDCGNRKWHPKTVADRKCSNSGDYPPMWDNPPFSDYYLFNSFQLCCSVLYEGKCTKEDVCTEIDRR